MNYKSFIFAITLVLFALTINAATTSTTGDITYYAYISNLSTPHYLPSIINPGDVVSMSIDISNISNSVSMDNLNVELNIGNNFTGTDLNQNIGTIAYGDSKTAIFTFNVNSDVVPGYYPGTLKLTYLNNGQLITEQKSLTIPISNTQKKLDVSITPNVINPGNKTDINFEIRNLSNIPVSNIYVSWSESSGLILPLGTDNQKYISVIAPNSTVNIPMIVASDPNITPGVYSLDLNISYSSSLGTTNQTSKVGLIVGGGTDFELSAEMQASGVLALSIANVGSNKAGAVVVKIPRQPGITVSGTNTAILGNINIGDFTLANFQLKTALDNNSTTGSNFQPNASTTQKTPRPDMNKDFNIGNGNRSNSLVLEIDYTDTTGVRQITQKTIQLNSTTTSNGLTKTNASSTSTFPTIPVVLLVIVIGLGALYNQFKAKNSWSGFAGYALLILVLYLISIYLFSSDMVSLIVVTIVSLLLLLWIFRSKKDKK